MAPNKVNRERVSDFTDLPNIGKAMAADFRQMGYTHPSQLRGADPFSLYQTLCALTKTRQDPCVLDVFISVTDFLDGGDPRPWWRFTAERKRLHPTL